MARIIQLYKQALRLDGSHVMTLCNYSALLHEYLHDVKGNLVEVEKMYNKALSIDANHIDTLRSHKSHRQSQVSYLLPRHCLLSLRGP